MRRRSRYRRLLATIAIALVVATGAYAYASSIGSLNAPSLGSGSDPIEKYSLGTVTYNLNANSPRNIDSVAFTLTGATSATTARVRLINTGTWYACNESAAPTITCTTAGVTAANANGNTFTVVATG